MLTNNILAIPNTEGMSCFEICLGLVLASVLVGAIKQIGGAIVDSFNKDKDLD